MTDACQEIWQNYLSLRLLYPFEYKGEHLIGGAYEIPEGKGVNIQTNSWLICGPLTKGRLPRILPLPTLVWSLSCFNKRPWLNILAIQQLNIAQRPHFSVSFFFRIGLYGHRSPMLQFCSALTFLPRHISAKYK